jgi:hypothetical protein
MISLNQGFAAGTARASLFLTPERLRVSRRSVVVERQELVLHRDLDAVALRDAKRSIAMSIDRRHDTVAELLLDQRLLGRAVDQHQFIEAVVGSSVGGISVPETYPFGLQWQAP